MSHLISGGALSARTMLREARRVYTRVIDWEDSFVGQPLASFSTTQDGLGGGMGFNAPSDANRFGQMRITRGTTNALGTAGAVSRVSTTTDGDGVLFGGGLIVFEMDFILDSGVPSAAQDFGLRMGFFDNTTPTTWLRANTSDGCFLEVDFDGVSAARYRASRWSNGVETVSTLTGTPDTAKHIFTMVVNPAGTSVEFFIDDVSIGVVTTGLPSGVNRLMGFGVIIQGKVGVANRSCNNDRIVVAQDFTNSR